METSHIVIAVLVLVIAYLLLNKKGESLHKVHHNCTHGHNCPHHYKEEIAVFSPVRRHN